MADEDEPPENPESDGDALDDEGIEPMGLEPLWGNDESPKTVLGLDDIGLDDTEADFRDARRAREQDES